ncbi:MAG TPA: septation protein A [Paucimonas sp.]|nr:septation protein A [Paucimonas sp.]
MKLLFDFFPVILFFSVFKWGETHADSAHALATDYLSAFVSGGAVAPTTAPILLATVIAFAATVLQILYLLARREKIHGTLWMSLGIIAILGGATVYFQNETFIKWKPTILYWGFASVFLISSAFFHRNLMRMSMQEQVKLPDPVWERLNVAWIMFFVLQGALNLYVAYTFSTSTWASFKLFGGIGLTFAFIIAQTFFLAKYLEEEPK